MREHCHRCRKPAAVCICFDVPRVANRTEVIILQHPKERQHPFGTARFAELGLRSVRTLVHYGLERSPSPLGALPPGTALIYPAADAPDLRSAPPPAALLFLDGTWSQSRTLYRINPSLSLLPRYRIEPRVASRYQIRSEPAEHFTSTIEAIAEALAIVEPELEGLDRLVAAFESMIARQLDYREQPNPRPKKQRAKRDRRALPEILRGERRIILAHGELSHGELVYIAAIDLEGACFESMIRPRRPPDDWWLEKAGLDRNAINGGAELETLRARWKTFAKDGDVLACWNRSTFESLAAATGHSSPGAVLKAVYCNLRSGSAGTLEEALSREGLAPEPNPFEGRSRRALAALIPVARRIVGR
jgi:DTW domain-containing protein